MKKLYLISLFFLTSGIFAQQNVFLAAKDYPKNYYVEAKKWFDGSSIDDSKIDGVIFKKNGLQYYVLQDYLTGNQINAKVFGVKADGITDDTANLQRAFDLSAKYGITLLLPYGTMITSGDLLIDLSKPNTKMRLLGSGASNTLIKNIGNSTTNALKVTGTYFNNLELRDFRIERDLSTPMPTGGTGLFIEKQVYASIENIEIVRFKKGLVMNDVSSLNMKRINARYCGQGFYFAKAPNGSSNPNLIEMHSCVLTSNTEWGITIVNGHSVNITSSLFEDNKLGGINFSYGGTNGATSLNLIGNYFEGNKGTDLYLRSDANGTHNIIGNTFNRVSTEQYSANNIVFEVSKSNSSAPLNQLNMIGNGFLNANNYKADSSRRTVKIIAQDYKKLQVSDSNFYQSDVDKPLYDKNIQLKN